MQRERNGLNSFPETFDLNQGPFPNNNVMDHSAPRENTLNPVDNRLSNYILAPQDTNPSCTNAPNNCGSGWNSSESSSNANNMKERVCADDSMRFEWSSSINSEADARPEHWSLRPSNVAGRSQNYSSIGCSLNSSHPCENDYQIRLGIGISHTLYKSDHSETEPIQTFCASSSSTVGASGSSSSLLEDNDASAPSVGTWVSSYRRKALDGTSGQFYAGRSSDANQTTQNITPLNVPGCYTVPENLSVSSGPPNLSPANHMVELNPRNGAGMSRVAPTLFPFSSVPGIAETSRRNFAMRSSIGHREPATFDMPLGASLRPSGVYTASHLSQPTLNVECSELRQTMNPPVNQHHFMQVNEAIGMHSHPWNGSFGLRGGSSSGPFTSSGERGLETREEANVRSPRRNNLEHPALVSASETRYVFPDQIDWSFVPGTSVSSRNQSYAPQIGQSSSGRRFSSISWLTDQNQSHQRVSEDAVSWISFPRTESDSGTRRSHLTVLHSGSSSSDEAATSNRACQPSDQRSDALLMDMHSGDVHDWHTLAAVDGRHRLIRQFLSAMRRRGVQLQAEDYVHIDPFLNGFTELHDRHRDMRLDVDNMSYEELLALEERIGTVSTGLSEEKIWVSMKQRKYESTQSLPKLEPCCICQEEYITGDAIGMLDCRHEFHTNCIKQWLTLKNLCPICKMTALGT